MISTPQPSPQPSQQPMQPSIPQTPQPTMQPFPQPSPSSPNVYPNQTSPQQQSFTQQPVQQPMQQPGQQLPQPTQQPVMQQPAQQQFQQPTPMSPFQGRIALFHPTQPAKYAMSGNISMTGQEIQEMLAWLRTQQPDHRGDYRLHVLLFSNTSKSGVQYLGGYVQAHFDRNGGNGYGQASPAVQSQYQAYQAGNHYASPTVLQSGNSMSQGVEVPF